MSELEQFMHRTMHFPKLVTCALIHYQFETIHPFLDGNGRLGRLLITLYLTWQGVLEKPILYISYYLKKHRQEYYDRLMLTRDTGNYEQWVSFFMHAVIEATEAALNDTKRIIDLYAEHEALLWKQKGISPLATQLLRKLLYHPLITIADVAQFLDISYPTAAHLVQQFVHLGILQEATGQKRSRKFVYHEYMKILSEGAEPKLESYPD